LFGFVCSLFAVLFLSVDFVVVFDYLVGVCCVVFGLLVGLEVCVCFVFLFVYLALFGVFIIVLWLFMRIIFCSLYLFVLGWWACGFVFRCLCLL